MIENFEEIETLMTEEINDDTKNIDLMNTKDIVQLINKEDHKVADAISLITDNIAKAIDACYEKMKNGGRLIYIGAGTSGRLGVLDASECPPTFGVDANVVCGVMAGGSKAIKEAKENIEDSKEAAIVDLNEMKLTDKDVVCGIAASGRTPYVISALQYANSMGAETLSICCVHGGLISQVSNYPIEAICGAEVISGSTRLKAGTAQKMILNMISTTVMIKLGKVYGNLMVDVKPTNEKLIERAKSIIMKSCDCSYEIAVDYFNKGKRNVKTAIIMYKTGKDLQESSKLLLEANGVISVVMNKVGGEK